MSSWHPIDDHMVFPFDLLIKEMAVMGFLMFCSCLYTVYFISPLRRELFEGMDISVSMFWHTVDSQLMSVEVSAIDNHLNSRHVLFVRSNRVLEVAFPFPPFPQQISGHLVRVVRAAAILPSSPTPLLLSPFPLLYSTVLPTRNYASSPLSNDCGVYRNEKADDLFL